MRLVFGGDRPNLLGEVELGGRLCYNMKAHHNGHNLSTETETLSCFVYDQYTLQMLQLWDPTSKLGEMVELGGQNVPIRICTIGFLLAPHTYQSAISNRFRTSQHRHRHTDRRTDGHTYLRLQ